MIDESFALSPGKTDPYISPQIRYNFPEFPDLAAHPPSSLRGAPHPEPFPFCFFDPPVRRAGFSLLRHSDG